MSLGARQWRRAARGRARAKKRERELSGSVFIPAEKSESEGGPGRRSNGMGRGDPGGAVARSPRRTAQRRATGRGLTAKKKGGEREWRVSARGTGGRRRSGALRATWAGAGQAAHVAACCGRSGGSRPVRARPSGRGKGLEVVEDTNPGIHVAATYGHPDRGWAGPETPRRTRLDYLRYKTPVG